MNEIRWKLKKLGTTNSYNFTAEVGKISQRSFGKKMINILLLKNLKLTGHNEILCETVWFDYRKRFQTTCVAMGDVISFRARVKEHEKGYCGDREYFHWVYGIMPLESVYDYKLIYPSKIKIEQLYTKQIKKIIFEENDLKIAANDNKEILQKTKDF